MKVMDVTDATSRIDNVEVNVMSDVVVPFFHVMDIVKFWIFVSRKIQDMAM